MINFKVPDKNQEKYKRINFPSGEFNVVLNQESTKELLSTTSTNIEANIWTAEHLFELAFLVNAIRHINPKIVISLDLPFVPFGRQDRHTEIGAAFSLQVVANLINTLAFYEVNISDPHSEVSLGLIKNSFRLYPPLLIDMYESTSHSDKTFIAPDKGAEGRAAQASKDYRGSTYVVANKTRDPSTGQINGIAIGDLGDTSGKTLIVIDDICDGGRTFIELAKVLPAERKRLELWVTHGIFSKGLQPLLKAGYDTIRSEFNFIYMGLKEKGLVE